MVKTFSSIPLSVGYIRDSLRKKSYEGDLFEALVFMLQQYDIINSRLKSYTRPQEYTVNTTGYDVV